MLIDVEYSSELPEKIEGKGEETRKYTLCMYLVLLSACDKVWLSVSQS